MAATLTPEQVQFLMDNGLRRVLRRDPDLPHQIVSLMRADYLVVSCNCLLRPGRPSALEAGNYEPIGARKCWQPGEAVAAWREHVAAAEAASA